MKNQTKIKTLVAILMTTTVLDAYAGFTPAEAEDKDKTPIITRKNKVEEVTPPSSAKNSPVISRRNSNSEKEEKLPYQFELLGKLSHPLKKDYQGKFKVTGRKLKEAKYKDLQVVIKDRAFDEAKLPADIHTLLPSQRPTSGWGKIQEKVKCKIKYKDEWHEQELLLPEEFRLHGFWDYQENTARAETIATLSLKIYKDRVWRTVHTRDVTIEHEKLREENAVPGRYFFDGERVFQTSTKLVHYRNKKTNTTYARNLFTTQNELPEHKGNTVIYVEPFAVEGNGLNPKEAYKGDYDLVDNCVGIEGREEGRLVYSDGTNIFQPRVTQEMWQKEQDKVGFFVASYTNSHRLEFNKDAKIPGGKLKTGLWHLVKVMHYKDKQIEKWKKLGEEAEEISIESKVGISSVPGIGLTAPHEVYEKTAENAHTENVNTLYTKVQDIENKLNEIKVAYDENAKFVIVIGRTGSGKSAVLNQLSGNLLKARMHKGKLVLEPEEERFKVSHEPNSETKLPTFWYDTAKKIVFVDCPGFEDTGNEETCKEVQDILNAYAIQKVFSPTSQVKILLTVPQADLKDTRLGELTHLFKNLIKLFPNDLEQMKKSLFLVITKGKTAQTGTTLVDVLAKDKQDKIPFFKKHSNARDILRYIGKNRDKHVLYFPKPVKEEEYPIDREEVLKQMEKVSYVEHLHPKMPDMADSVIYIEALSKKANSFLANYLKTEGVQRFYTYCQKKVDQYTGSIEDLRREMQTLVKRLRKIQEKPDISPDVFLAKLRKIVGNDDFLGLQKVEDTIGQLNFLKSIKPDVELQVEKWANSLGGAIKKIEILGTKPTGKLSAQVLSIKGSLIGASDIVREAAANPGLKRIDVFGTNTFFIDEDTTFKGINLNIIVPHWKVMDQRTINLSGDDMTTQAGHGPNAGDSGLPGLPGKNGGSFYGRGITFESLENLTINVNGGRGGKGGNGAAGKNAISGVVGTAESLRSFQNVAIVGVPQAFSNRHPVDDYETKEGNNPWQTRTSHHTHAFLKGTMTTYSHGNETGSPATNGGSPGAGGKGGFPGNIVLVGQKGNMDGYQFSCSKGSKGDAGEPGGGGSGGTNGPVIQGKYFTGLNGHYAHTVQRGLWKDVYSWECRQSDHWEEVNVLRAATQINPGNAGSGENKSGRQSREAQPTTIDLSNEKTMRMVEFIEYYQKKASDPSSSPFVKLFPGL